MTGPTSVRISTEQVHAPDSGYDTALVAYFTELDGLSARMARTIRVDGYYSPDQYRAIVEDALRHLCQRPDLIVRDSPEERHFARYLRGEVSSPVSDAIEIKRQAIRDAIRRDDYTGVTR